MPTSPRPLSGRSIWRGDLPRGPGQPFYRRLNEILDQHGFDAHVEELCATFYAKVMGRPSLPPRIYFCLLLIGYFEGIDSERAIAWRAADSISLRVDRVVRVGRVGFGPASITPRYPARFGEFGEFVDPWRILYDSAASYQIRLRV